MSPPFPFNIAMMLWDVASVFTRSWADAMRFYHELMLELLEYCQ